MDVGRPMEERKYRNIFHCIQTVYNKHGFRAFYKGAMTNAIRGSGSALVLMFYDTFERMIFKKKE